MQNACYIPDSLDAVQLKKNMYIIITFLTAPSIINRSPFGNVAMQRQCDCAYTACLTACKATASTAISLTLPKKLMHFDLKNDYFF